MYFVDPNGNDKKILSVVRTQGTTATLYEHNINVVLKYTNEYVNFAIVNTSNTPITKDTLFSSMKDYHRYVANGYNGFGNCTYAEYYYDTYELSIGTGGSGEEVGYATSEMISFTDTITQL